MQRFFELVKVNRTLKVVRGQKWSKSMVESERAKIQKETKREREREIK